MASRNVIEPRKRNFSAANNMLFFIWTFSTGCPSSCQLWSHRLSSREILGALEIWGLCTALRKAVWPKISWHRFVLQCFAKHAILPKAAMQTHSGATVTPFKTIMVNPLTMEVSRENYLQMGGDSPMTRTTDVYIHISIHICICISIKICHQRTFLLPARNGSRAPTGRMSHRIAQQLYDIPKETVYVCPIGKQICTI